MRDVRASQAQAGFKFYMTLKQHPVSTRGSTAVPSLLLQTLRWRYGLRGLKSLYGAEVGERQRLRSAPCKRC
ncbi:hypothetical protein SKAU_G00353010 [Synaphobranchus kaupii]|uniref:Uncharacterized protein n=1 Tax=Synaphobranchus kaupii TaxID=118154 RepID=A0A9Q1EKY8_SYNKA|nr:hypothetical protein SKAU_G00353010 [Synaphobranchus kaupii]